MNEKPEFKTIKEFVMYYFNHHLFQKSTFYGIAFGFLYFTNTQFKLHADEILGSSATVEAIIVYLIGKKG
jgi:hypothetical protein